MKFCKSTPFTDRNLQCKTDFALHLPFRKYKALIWSLAWRFPFSNKLKVFLFPHLLMKKFLS